jgi:hypothetical protein
VVVLHESLITLERESDSSEMMPGWVSLLVIIKRSP